MERDTKQAPPKRPDENESVIGPGEEHPEAVGQNDQRWPGGSSRDPEKGKNKP